MLTLKFRYGIFNSKETRILRKKSNVFLCVGKYVTYYVSLIELVPEVYLYSYVRKSTIFDYIKEKKERKFKSKKTENLLKLRDIVYYFHRFVES